MKLKKKVAKIESCQKMKIENTQREKNQINRMATPRHMNQTHTHTFDEYDLIEIWC